MSDVTRILAEINQGDLHASERLLPLVYDELRKLAGAKLACEKPGHSLQATALVHEAYVRLVDADKRQEWDSRGHFFASAAEAMRRILVEQARRHRARKHGGDRQRVELDDRELELDKRNDEVLAVSEALSELETHDRQAAELVKLRFFAGFGHQESAEILGISRRAADRLWATARAWLYAELKED